MLVADQGWVDVLVAARDLLGGVRVLAALVGEGRLADKRRLGIGPEVRQLVEEQRQVAQLLQVAPRSAPCAPSSGTGWAEW